MDHLRKGGADDPIEQTKEPEPHAVYTHSSSDKSMLLPNPMPVESPVPPRSDDQTGGRFSSREGVMFTLRHFDNSATQYVTEGHPIDYMEYYLLDHHLGERSVMYAF